MKFEDIILVVGGTLTGLLAGVFYAFSVAIVPALRSIKGTQHIAALYWFFSHVSHRLSAPSSYNETKV